MNQEANRRNEDWEIYLFDNEGINDVKQDATAESGALNTEHSQPQSHDIPAFKTK